ncbi:hypothetical protein CFOL_v3_10485 [Cephalotus follicularis]|uniref:Uncharacterized protein n=1 Tax=Cephalotus follicularis TaxID=3775 RepID=A0A1Q3BG14_CEPFO|nr:hypothetical protein CFOL_v3_10485 [Cephalotus follicularis]
MNHRIRFLRRQSPTKPEPYLKYLKPGALARLRDSRISARSHRLNSLLQISLAHRSSPPSSPPSNDGQTLVNAFDAFPCFAARVYGPRCPQRKKLLAAKAGMFFNSTQTGHASASPDPIIDLFSSDILVAH